MIALPYQSRAQLHSCTYTYSWHVLVCLPENKQHSLLSIRLARKRKMLAVSSDASGRPLPGRQSAIQVTCNPQHLRKDSYSASSPALDISKHQTFASDLICRRWILWNSKFQESLGAVHRRYCSDRSLFAQPETIQEEFQLPCGKVVSSLHVLQRSILPTRGLYLPISLPRH